MSRLLLKTEDCLIMEAVVPIIKRDPFFKDGLFEIGIAQAVGRYQVYVAPKGVFQLMKQPKKSAWLVVCLVP